MNNPVDQPKVSELDATAGEAAWTACLLACVRSESITRKAFDAGLRAYLVALPQPLIGIPGAEKGGLVALLPGEIAERYERAIAAIKALPADAPNIDLVADVAEIAADLSDIAKRALYAAPRERNS